MFRKRVCREQEHLSFRVVDLADSLVCGDAVSADVAVTIVMAHVLFSCHRESSCNQILPENR